MRLIFFGMPGRLSGPPLLALLAAGFEVAAVVVPAAPGAPPLSALPALAAAPSGLALPLAGPPPPSLLQVAAGRRLPVLAAGRSGSAALASEIAGRAVDLACVVCWPWRLPPPLLAAPRHGFLNLHPSLLPDLRGPEPLFWAFREGRERSGVTIHAMDAGFDSGPIARQAALELPAGISGPAAEARAADVGAGLLVAALRDLEAGRLTLRPQGGGARFLRAPAAADFAIDPAWPARRAFAFMCGTADWGRPYPLALTGAELLLAEALAYDSDHSLGAPYELAGDIARVQLSPGVLTARLFGDRDR